jgi:hypothetical protein
VSTEKSKNRLEVTSEELERVLLQKEGESLKDGGIQGRTPTGKRAIGKAVAKGGLLLKGKNPGNVRPFFQATIFSINLMDFPRFSDKNTMSEPECRRLRMRIVKLCLIHRQFDKNISISSYHGYYG